MIKRKLTQLIIACLVVSLLMPHVALSATAPPYYQCATEHQHTTETPCTNEYAKCDCYIIVVFVFWAQAYYPQTLKGTQPDPFFCALHGNLQSCVTQSGNLFMFVMHNPVYFIDPSGLSAMSVRHEEQRNPDTGRNLNVYTLHVQPHWLTNTQTVAGGIPGFGLVNWGGQRLAGYRNISMYWTVASGSVMDVLSTVIGGKVGWGINAFGNSDSIRRYDPLAGRYITFNRNDWYFFALDEAAHGTIGRAENNILICWGSASPRLK